MKKGQMVDEIMNADYWEDIYKHYAREGLMREKYSKVRELYMEVRKNV